jgi:hypothetical protein
VATNNEENEKREDAELVGAAIDLALVAEKEMLPVIEGVAVLDNDVVGVEVVLGEPLLGGVTLGVGEMAAVTLGEAPKEREAVDVAV